MIGVGYYVFDKQHRLLLVKKEGEKNVYKDRKGKIGWVVPGAQKSTRKNSELNWLYDDIKFLKKHKSEIRDWNDVGNWIHQNNDGEGLECIYSNYVVNLPHIENLSSCIEQVSEKTGSIIEAKFFSLWELPNLSMLTASFFKSLLFHVHDSIKTNAGSQLQEKFRKVLGEVSQRFFLFGTAGKGGYGDVYKVLDISTLKSKAIKIVRPNASDPKWEERFILEGATLMRILQEKKLKDNIERIDSINAINEHSVNTYFLVKEFIPGENLQVCFDNGDYKYLTESLVCKIMKKILDALKQIHLSKSRICHRDLKPNNIMLQVDSGNCDKVIRLTLIDFGLCKSDQDGVNTSEDFLVGDTIYQSINTTIEYLNHNMIDDYYSALQIFHWLLFGENPYNMNKVEVRKEKLKGVDMFLNKTASDFKKANWNKSLKLFISFFNIIKKNCSNMHKKYGDSKNQDLIMKEIHSLFSKGRC